MLAHLADGRVDPIANLLAEDIGSFKMNSKLVADVTLRGGDACNDSTNFNCCPTNWITCWVCCCLTNSAGCYRSCADKTPMNRFVNDIQLTSTLAAALTGNQNVLCGILENVPYQINPAMKALNYLSGHSKIPFYCNELGHASNKPFTQTEIALAKKQLADAALTTTGMSSSALKKQVRSNLKREIESKTTIEQCLALYTELPVRKQYEKLFNGNPALASNGLFGSGSRYPSLKISAIEMLQERAIHILQETKREPNDDFALATQLFQHPLFSTLHHQNGVAVKWRDALSMRAGEAEVYNSDHKKKVLAAITAEISRQKTIPDCLNLFTDLLTRKQYEKLFSATSTSLFDGFFASATNYSSLKISIIGMLQEKALSILREADTLDPRSYLRLCMDVSQHALFSDEHQQNGVEAKFKNALLLRIAENC